MPNYTPQISEIYDYLSAPELPPDARPTVVFGRNDIEIARAASSLILDGLVSATVISGGVGKDTGDLLARGYRSEAHFLGDLTIDYLEWPDYTPMPPIYLDEKAKHGGENARNGLRILQKNGHPINITTGLAYATSLRRLTETQRFEAAKQGIETPRVYRVPAAHTFDPRNPADRAEVLDEFLRLADWPARGLLLPQDDIPADLVDFAHDTGRRTPRPPSHLASTVLGMLPKPIQLHVIHAVK